MDRKIEMDRQPNVQTDDLDRSSETSGVKCARSQARRLIPNERLKPVAVNARRAQSLNV